MEGLADPRVFESRAGFLVGVALLAVFFIVMAAEYVAEAAAKRRHRVAERGALAEEDKEQTRKAA